MRINLTKFNIILSSILFIILSYHIYAHIQKINWLNAKITKTRQDCKTFGQAVMKYNSLYKSPLLNLSELNGIFLCSQPISAFKDPWGGQYYVNTNKGYIYSNGPDNISFTDDDIIESFLPNELTLTNAKIDNNPKKLSPPKAYDILHLYFNKKVFITNDITINLNDENFIYYSIDKSIIPPPCQMPNNIKFSSNFNISDSTTTGSFYWGSDSTEIIIRFPDGQYDLIQPNKYYINLSGKQNKKNSLFKQANEIDVDKSINANQGALTSKWPILIRN